MKFVYTTGILLLLVLSGCASLKPAGPQPLMEKQRQQLGTVLVEPSYESDEWTSGITTGKGMGAAKGAGRATGEWLGASMSSGEPVGLLVGLVLTPVVAIAGGVYGGVVADGAEAVEQHQIVLQKVLGTTSTAYARQLNQQLGQLTYVDSVISNNRSMPHQSRLEVSFQELRGSGGGPKSELRFTLLTETRLYLSSQPEPAYIRTYQVASKTKRLSAWADQNGTPLQVMVDELAHTTVAKILDDHFRNSAYSIVPLFPAHNYVFKPKRLKTAQPTFRWQLKDGNREVSANESGGLEYELRVFDDLGGIYETAGLKTGSFQFAESLPACGTFRWSTRAHYETFGEPRSTPWAQDESFRTPCPKHSG